MKKIYQLLIIFLIPALAILFAFTSGPPAGNTGSPLDGQDCTNCHLPGPAIEMANWISHDIPTEGYTPGVTYTVTVTAVDIAADKMGFQITSESTTAKTGTFIITDAERTQLTTSTTVSHTTLGTTSTGIPNSWTMDWTAPAAGTGTVTFAAAINVTNDDGTNSGDMIYVSAHNVFESNVGIDEDLSYGVGEIYPNPAQEYIKLNVPVRANIKLFDNSGRELMNSISNQETEIIDVSQLVNGLYFVHIYYDGQTASRRFIKR